MGNITVRRVSPAGSDGINPVPVGTTDLLREDDKVPDVKMDEPVPDTVADKPDSEAEDISEPAKSDGDEPKVSNSDARPNKFKRFLSGYWRRKLWTLPLTVVGIIILAGGAAMALPSSRYMLLGYFIQRPFKVIVTDSITGSPVTGAAVTLNGQKKQTSSSGEVSFTVPVGNGSVTVSKAYYKSATLAVLVDLSASANSLKVPLVATGRQVPVKVVNKITGKPIPEAVIAVGSTNAKTDLNGQATIVVPASVQTQDATLTVDGYNDLTAKVQVTTKVVDANTFAMVPKGKMYFLSNLSGNLDVVSTNLDGSSRKTVLAGTGSEDRNNTLLLAARDWKYLALLSKRAGGTYAKLYLIDTTNDSLTTVDASSANFTLVGWSGHYFVYNVQRPDVKSWLPNQQSIVSYNADTKAPKTLVSSTASGTNSLDAKYQDIVYTIFLGSNLIYTTTWYQYPSDVHVAGQTNTIMSIKPDGTGSKTLKSVDAATSYIDSVNLAAPDKLYFAVYAASTNYYRLDTNGNITQSSTITADTVNQTYPTYLQSPSGTSTFWTSLRDGKNTLFVGDASGLNGNQIASLSDYSPYGWFTDSYLLVQKNKSELYILPAAGGTPLKISDYFKPDYAFYGYGGGYGGL